MLTDHTENSHPNRVALVACVVAILACLPYLGLKALWILGSEVGVPAGSDLHDHPTAMRLANGATLIMDAAVVVLALVLIGPWGRRIPAWLLVFPLWVATGLLTPIALGFPVQLALDLVAGPGPASESRDAFLAPWVFPLVYGGFVLQALALGTLFVVHARQRWGHLWQGRVTDLVPRAIDVPLQFAASLVGVMVALPLVAHAYWATGGEAGLNDLLSDNFGRNQVLNHVLDAGLLLAAFTGTWVLAFALGRSRRVVVPFVLAWVGSAALFAWGAWSSVIGLVGEDDESRATGLMSLVTTLEIGAALVILVSGLHFLAERGRRPSPSGAPELPTAPASPARAHDQVEENGVEEYAP